VAASLARSVAKPGGAVLIFVSGMADITELMEVLTTQLQSQQGQAGVKKGGGSAVAAGECLLIDDPSLSAGTAVRAYVANQLERVHCLLCGSPCAVAV
jgi:HrpA-like RNA helicase